MNLVRVGLTLALATAMAACSGTPLMKRGAYNLGGCAPQTFAAIHVVITGTTLVATSISDGPKNQDKIDNPPVFKFVIEDADGVHFKNEETDLVLKFEDGTVVGMLSVNGEPKSMLYGAKGSEADLKKDGAVLYTVCQKLWGEKDHETLPVPSAELPAPDKL